MITFMRMFVVVNMLLLVISAGFSALCFISGSFAIGLWHIVNALVSQYFASVIGCMNRTKPWYFLAVSSLTVSTLVFTLSAAHFVETEEGTLGLLFVLGISILFPIVLDEQLRVVNDE